MEDRFLKGAGVTVGTMAHLADTDRDSLTISLIAQEAVDSSAIEGEILDRASVQSSVAKHLGMLPLISVARERRRGGRARLN